MILLASPEVKITESRTTDAGSKAHKLHEEGLSFFHKAEKENFKEERLQLYRKAIELWLREFDIVPDNPNTANNIGIAYANLKDYHSAIKYHELAIKIDPMFGHAYSSGGRAYYASGNFAMAADYYSKAVELNYEPMKSYFSLGLTFCNLRDYNKAIATFTNALKYGYDREDCLFSIGQAYYSLHQYDKSIENFQLVAIKCPYYSKVHLYLGKCYKAQGRMLAARNEFKKARGSQYTRRDADSAKEMEIIDRQFLYYRLLDFIVQLFFIAFMPLAIPICCLWFFRNRGLFFGFDKQKVFIFAFLMLFLPAPFYMTDVKSFLPALASVSFALPTASMAYGLQKVQNYLFVYINYLGLIVVNYFIACLLYRIIKNESVLWITNGIITAVSLHPIYWFFYSDHTSSDNILELVDTLWDSLSLVFGTG